MNPEFNKLLNQLNSDRKVPCKLCGKETPYIRIQSCENCWEMEKGIVLLIKQDKKKAKEWLQEQLKGLE